MNKNIGFLLFVFIAVLLLLSASSAAFNFYIDWLFFKETGVSSVFSTALSAKVRTALVFGAVFLVYYLVNIYAANRIDFPLRNLHIFGDTLNPVKTLTVDKPVKFITIAGGFIIAPEDSGPGTKSVNCAGLSMTKGFLWLKKLFK